MRWRSSRTRAQPDAPAPQLRRPGRSPLERALVPAVLALSIALAGCLGGAGGEIVEPAAVEHPPHSEQDLTYKAIETVRVNFPFGPTDPAPVGPAVAVPENTAALKFEISWRSTTGNMVWSSFTPPPPATEPVSIQLEWSDGGHAATIEMDTSLHVHAPPTDGDGEFETQTETLPLDPARGATLQFSPTGWGDLWAIVDVSAGTRTNDGPTTASAGPNGAGEAAAAGSVPVEQPVSIDLGIGLHVFYVYSHRCAVDFVEVDGPIINVDVTATWDHSVPVVGENLELTIYNGSTIPQDPHTRFPQGNGIGQIEGPSPLSLDADVAAGNQVGLVVCDWSHVVVRQGFDVHIEGTIRYLASAPGAP